MMQTRCATFAATNTNACYAEGRSIDLGLWRSASRALSDIKSSGCEAQALHLANWIRKETILMNPCLTARMNLAHTTSATHVAINWRQPILVVISDRMRLATAKATATGVKVKTESRGEGPSFALRGGKRFLLAPAICLWVGKLPIAIQAFEGQLLQSPIVGPRINTAPNNRSPVSNVLHIDPETLNGWGVFVTGAHAEAIIRINTPMVYPTRIARARWWRSRIDEHTARLSDSFPSTKNGRPCTYSRRIVDLAANVCFIHSRNHKKFEIPILIVRGCIHTDKNVSVDI